VGECGDNSTLIGGGMAVSVLFTRQIIHQCRVVGVVTSQDGFRESLTIKFDSKRKIPSPRLCGETRLRLGALGVRRFLFF
jgi:hypothetical protein